MSTRSIPHIIRLSRYVYAHADYERLGMNTKQLATLASLRDRGELPQQALCDVLHMSQNTVVAWLNELEDRGYVRRERDSDDRRKHNVAITSEGVVALEAGEAELRRLEDEALSGLSDADHKQLRALLTKALETAPK